MSSLLSEQIKTKERVAKHGEVLTGEREVQAMLDLVQQETYNIESRFLEPACGDGNFLDEILNRKLSVVNSRYSGSPIEWERYAFIAVTSVYGIDILEDNVIACRERLFSRLFTFYKRSFGKQLPEPFAMSIKFVLSKNIIWGDALTLCQCAATSEPIIFTEWSPINGRLIKRKEFKFNELLPGDEEQNSLFDSSKQRYTADTGSPVYFPVPVREFPPTHYLKLSE